jgi:hypothetical protein
MTLIASAAFICFDRRTRLADRHAQTITSLKGK